MNSPLIHYEAADSAGKLHKLTLFVLISGVLYCTLTGIAGYFNPLFYVAYFLLFLPFLIINRTLLLYVFVLSFAYALPLAVLRNNVYVRIDDLLFVVIVMIWFFNKALNAQQVNSKRFLAKPLLIWAGITFFSILVMLPDASTLALNRSAYFFLRFVQYILVYFIVADSIKELNTRDNLMTILWLSTLFICIYGLVQYYIIDLLKATGPLSPNHAHIGIYLLFLFFIFAGYIRSCRKFIGKFLFAIILPLMVYVLFLSASRAAILGLFFGVFAALIFSKKPLLLLLAFVFIVIGIYIGSGFLADLKNTGLSSAQFQNMEEDLSTLGRLLIWAGIYKFFVANPFALVFGVGLGGFERAVLPYVPYMKSANGAHNNYLHILTEAGIVGLIIFLYIMFRLLRKSLHNFYNQERHDRALNYGYFCGLCALLFTCLTQETFSVQPALFNFLGYFFLITAIIFVSPKKI